MKAFVGQDKISFAQCKWIQRYTSPPPKRNKRETAQRVMYLFVTFQPSHPFEYINLKCNVLGFKGSPKSKVRKTPRPPTPSGIKPLYHCISALLHFSMGNLTRTSMQMKSYWIGFFNYYDCYSGRIKTILSLRLWDFLQILLCLFVIYRIYVARG